MNWQWFRFDEFKPEVLYDVLRLRSQIFVVEQECPYLDCDGKDQEAMHCLGYDEKGTLVAYARVFTPEDTCKPLSFGRVVVDKAHRQHGYGRALMTEILRWLESGPYCQRAIHISAQHYLEKFYASFRFESYGEVYLEDDIDHIAMIKQPPHSV